MTHIVKTSKRKCVLLLPKVSPKEKFECPQGQVSGAISQVSVALRAWAGPVRGTFGSGDIQRRSCWGLVFKAGNCNGDTVWCLVFVSSSSCGASDIAVKSQVIVEWQVCNPL